MKKKSLIFTSITIIVLAIAIIISLVFVFNQKDTKAYNSKLEQAQKYVAKVDYKKAEATYLEAIKINPKQTKAYVELADVYMNNGKEDKAVEILKQGYKNVESTADKKEIKDKQKKIENQIKNNMGVINNGGDYVTYKGKSYYWEYHENSFAHPDSRGDELLYYDRAVNDLISVDENGNKKIIYSGYATNGIWIYNDKIYIDENYGDVYSNDTRSIVSMKLDGSDQEHLNTSTYSIYDICDKGLILCNTFHGACLLNDDIKNEEDLNNNLIFNGELRYFNDNILYFEYSDYDSKTTTLKSIDINGENETTLVKMDYRDYVSCMQVIDDYIYFQYGSDYGGKIAKVKKDGTGFTDLEDNETDKFTAYKSKNGKVVFKHGGALNKPFEKDGSVYAYTDQSSECKKLMSSSEYKDMGNYPERITYSDGELYFVCINVEGSTYSYSYCKKDLKTNKITVYLKIDAN